MTFLYILLGILLLLTLLLSLTIAVTVSYKDELSLTLSVLFFKYKLYPKKKKRINPSDYSLRAIRKRQRKEAKKALKKRSSKTNVSQKAAKKRTLGQNIRIIRVLTASLFERFRGRLRLGASRIHIDVATGDAATTAVLFGVINQAVLFLTESLSHFDMLRQNKSDSIYVRTDFVGTKTKVDIELVFSIRIHHILDILIKTVLSYFKEKNKKDK